MARWPRRLVELFPTRIRYTSMSLPYHIGNGWFGGLLPASMFAMNAQNGSIYFGLWYPIVIAGATVVIGLLFVPETKDRDIFIGDFLGASGRHRAGIRSERCRLLSRRFARPAHDGGLRVQAARAG